MDEQLIAAALAAREKSYCPYSGFSVGAALMGVSGKIYTGCNVECVSYPAGNCAERTVFCKAVSEGEQKFLAIAVAGGSVGRSVTEYCPPCGICRQIMREFADPEEFRIVLTDGKNQKSYLLKELLPESFGPDHLEGGCP